MCLVSQTVQVTRRERAACHRSGPGAGEGGWCLQDCTEQAKRQLYLRAQESEPEAVYERRKQPLREAEILVWGRGALHFLREQVGVQRQLMLMELNLFPQADKTGAVWLLQFFRLSIISSTNTYRAYARHCALCLKSTLESYAGIHQTVIQTELCKVLR